MGNAAPDIPELLGEYLVEQDAVRFDEVADGLPVAVRQRGRRAGVERSLMPCRMARIRAAEKIGMMPCSLASSRPFFSLSRPNMPSGEAKSTALARSATWKARAFAARSSASSRKPSPSAASP